MKSPRLFIESGRAPTFASPIRVSEWLTQTPEGAAAWAADFIRSRVRLANRIFGTVRFEVVHERGDDHVEMDITFSAPDRDTGDPIRLSLKEAIWGSTIVGMPAEVREGFVAERVRDILFRVVTHEVDENLLVDDVRRFDPHRNDPR